MRWTNKIMQGSQDQNNSRLSSRSLSKFKKVNLQKSQIEISSNSHFQKSELKLTSVEKIKQSNNNRSYISNYITHANGNANNNHMPSPISGNAQRPTFQFKTLHQKKTSIFAPFFSENTTQNFIPQDNQKFQQQFQGLALFHKQSNFQNTNNKLTQKNSVQIISQDNPPQIQLHQILQKIHQLMEKFKEVSLKIKQNIKQTSLIAYQKLQTNLISFVEGFKQNFQHGIKQLIEIKSNQINDLDLQKILKNDLNVSQKASSQSFYKIKFFEHQQVYHYQKQKQETKNRPNCFKNKFKQLVVDSDQNMCLKNQVEKEFIRQTFGPEQKSPKKLSRKRTNPTPRVNFLFDNESTILNQNSLNQDHNASNSSIKYCKINDRSASRSVKKLHQKIVMIKNIFKSDTTQIQRQKSQNLRQVTSKG